LSTRNQLEKVQNSQSAQTLLHNVPTIITGNNNTLHIITSYLDVQEPSLLDDNLISFDEGEVEILTFFLLSQYFLIFF
jgi:hypothetical protein